jgi:alkaline phosphatase
MHRATVALVASIVTAATGLGAIAAEPSEYERAAARVAARSDGVARSARRAKNVILFVGDGMGISTITAARILDGQQRGVDGEENRSRFERLQRFWRWSVTFSANQQTSDSAPTATAMVTGMEDQ